MLKRSLKKLMRLIKFFLINKNVRLTINLAMQLFPPKADQPLAGIRLVVFSRAHSPGAIPPVQEEIILSVVTLTLVIHLRFLNSFFLDPPLAEEGDFQELLDDPDTQ